MSSVGANTGVGQDGAAGAQTANPQRIGSQSLQTTSQLQGVGGQTNVLGVSDVLRSPNTSPTITVEGSDGSNATDASQTRATTEATQAPPISPNDFVFSPWLIGFALVVLVFVAARFMLIQRQSHNFRD